ncbi:MAG: hypothetical protein JW846_01975 [Dehalococcoidia bacterium]|nr:hypothetical protein [Dehalococcoidia bacterium]
MRHVLGIASAALAAGDPAFRTLELDFLRLAYAVAHLNAKGDDTCGYIVVLRQEIRDVLRRLRAKYEVGDGVNIVFASLLVSDMTRLSDASDLLQSDDSSGAGRDIAREVALSSLRREVFDREPCVEELVSTVTLPFDVAWDFYGVVRDDSLQSESAVEMSPRLF